MRRASFQQRELVGKVVLADSALPLGYGVAGDSARGTGVSGESTSGYGGQFKGGKAQLKLVPGGSTGAPTTGKHTKGEIYMDSAGALFVCVADGTPGTWRKVTTTAV